MKQLILRSIYQAFDAWALHLPAVCHRGCATCCTQDVTMTAPEAETIFSYIEANCLEEWLAEKLDRGLPPDVPAFTTNEFARFCLNGEDVDPGGGKFDRICPFLEEAVCSIYEARPFSCRCFISTSPCRRETGGASVPQYFMAATSAVSQIIEHLGQHEPWGNMLHLLALLARQDDVPGLGVHFSDRGRYPPAPPSCRVAQPLPGFLISEDDYPLVVPLLETIFDLETGGKRLEDILNGR